jgi:hypothetical protein
MEENKNWLGAASENRKYPAPRFVPWSKMHEKHGSESQKRDFALADQRRVCADIPER